MTILLKFLWIFIKLGSVKKFICAETEMLVNSNGGACHSRRSKKKNFDPDTDNIVERHFYPSRPQL